MLHVCFVIFKFLKAATKANNTMYHLRDRSRDLVSVSGLTVKLLLSDFEDETKQFVKNKSPPTSPSVIFLHTHPTFRPWLREGNIVSMLFVT